MNKQLVFHAANILMLRTGSCTTLEVKNSLYDVFLGQGNPNRPHAPVDSTFQLSQNEVSGYMNELYTENNWDRTMQSFPVAHYSYSDPTLTVIADPNASYATQPSLGTFNQAGPTAPVVTTPAITPATPSATTSAITKLDAANGPVVAYLAGHPEKRVQSATHKDARSLCFKTFNPTEIGLVYDDIRRCSVDFYNRKYATVS